VGLVAVTREMLAVDLRTYGEDRLAATVENMPDDVLLRIGELAFEKASGPKGERLLAKALALATVEVVEGKARSLRWSRRKLKGIYPGV